MKKWLKRAAKGFGAVLVIGAAAFALYVQLRWDRTFDAPFPTLHATTDSATIARGRYLAQGPAHCASCHSASSTNGKLATAADLPLSGGHEFDVLGGIVYTPNITSDSTTGIGRFTDAQLARSLRHGVRHDGRAMLPFMEFQQLADSDLVAVISYLRATAPVSKAVPAHRYSFVSKAIMALLIKPLPAEATPPLNAPAGISRERGAYMANSVAHCVSCHTNRDQFGGYIGARFAGGLTMESETKDGLEFVTPNLTPDASTGRIAQWTADQFVTRIRAGRVHEGSPMPWESFARMSDDDLRSIFAYLKSLPAVANNTGQSVRRVASSGT